MFDPWTQQDVWSETFTGWNNGQNPALKGTLVNGEMAAVVQTDGKFVLLNLADGHKIIDTELKEEKDEHGLLQNIQVIASPDQYFLLTNRQPQPGVVTPPMHGTGDVRNAISNSQPVITMNAEPISQIMSGHVYAFERSTGKPQWSGPAAIDQHGYLPGQPSELPVLTFVRNVNAFSATRNAQSTRGSVLCLDKRTGRAVYSDDDIQPLNGFEITGNPEEKTVTLAFAGQPNQPATPPVTLKFTDTPVADAAPYQAGEADKPDSAKETKDKDKE